MIKFSFPHQRDFLDPTNSFRPMGILMGPPPRICLVFFEVQSPRLVNKVAAPIWNDPAPPKPASQEGSVERLPTSTPTESSWPQVTLPYGIIHTSLRARPRQAQSRTHQLAICISSKQCQPTWPPDPSRAKVAKPWGDTQLVCLE